MSKTVSSKESSVRLMKFVLASIFMPAPALCAEAKASAALQSTWLHSGSSAGNPSHNQVAGVSDKLPEYRQQTTVDNFEDSTQTNQPNANKWHYIGNSVSLKYHEVHCEFARVMMTNRRQLFARKKDAQKAGMKPCCWCFPTRQANCYGHIIENRPPPNISQCTVTTPADLSDGQ